VSDNAIKQSGLKLATGQEHFTERAFVPKVGNAAE
jgi:hypothetical protein